MSLKKKTLHSITNMSCQYIISVLCGFFLSILVIRALPREEYGALSLIHSYKVIFGLINLSPETILLRDYPKLKEDISVYRTSFILFGLVKCIIFIFISFLIAGYLIYSKNNWRLIYILVFSTATIIIESFSQIDTTILSVDFRQGLITKVICVSSFVNILFTFGVFLWSSAIYVAVKNLLVTLISLILYLRYVVLLFKIKFRIQIKESLIIIKRCLLEFSLWTHLGTVMHDVIYRGDLLILGWLNVSLRSIGNYNIALQLSNMIIPIAGILQYNTFLGISNLSDDQERRDEVVQLFIKVSFLLSFFIIISYSIFGKLLIGFITNFESSNEVYNWGYYIIGGLCILNIFKPFISYGMATQKVKDFVLYVNLPNCLFAISAYLISGILYGVKGVAVANLITGIFMSLVIITFIVRKTDFRWKLLTLTETDKKSIHAILYFNSK